MKILLLVAIIFLSYVLAQKIIDQNIFSKIHRYLMEKDEKYYAELLKYYEKNKKVKLTTKLNLFHRIHVLIDRTTWKRSILLNPITLILLSILCLCGTYGIVKNILEIPALSLLVSLPSVAFPFIFLSLVGNYQQEKIEKILLNFLLQLKNYTKINNDIIYAFQEVKVMEPLKSYIDKFLLEVHNGVRIETAIEHLKEKIHIQSFRTLLNHMQHCYLYGGSFSELIDKNYESIAEMQKEKEKRVQETRGARMVLLILIVLDLLVYFTFISHNYENYRIMQNSLFGNVILYWNFISMWLLIMLSYHVKKLDY